MARELHLMAARGVPLQHEPHHDMESIAWSLIHAMMVKRGRNYTPKQDEHREQNRPHCAYILVLLILHRIALKVLVHSAGQVILKGLRR